MTNPPERSKRPELTATDATRGPLADDRDRAADLRELLADDRDRAADARERAADDRDRSTDARERAADERDKDTELRELLADSRVEVAEHQAAGLKLALETRGVIEQAKGMLMLTLKIDADAAFDVLVRRSQKAHTKLAVVAREIVANGTHRAE